MASPGEISTSELVEHCQLEERVLNLEVSSDRFHEICRSLSQWRRLAPILNVEEAVENIENDYRGNEDMKKNAFLTAWKQKYAMKATYRRLIAALLSIERAEDARKICQILSAFSPGSRPPPSPSGVIDERDKGDYTVAKESLPHLKSKNLSPEEMNRLKARLRMESKDIRDEFACLFSETEESLNCQKVTALSLKLLLQSFEIPQLKDFDDGITEIMSEVFHHCCFYSFRILKRIIGCFGTTNDKDRLATYEANFKHYSERRLCEVPTDALAARKSEGNEFCVKTDKVFDVPCKEILDIETELSRILDKPVYLRDVEHGCVKLSFYILHELVEVFPLNKEQMKQLKGIGVLRMYDQHHQYYPPKGSHNFGI